MLCQGGKERGGSVSLKTVHCKKDYGNQDSDYLTMRKGEVEKKGHKTM